MTTDFIFEQCGGVGTLTLRPPAEGKPPTLDHDSLDQLDRTLGAIESAASTGELRLLFVVSASPKFFCVGANVAVLATINPDTIRPWIEHGHRVFRRLEDLPLPTVARVEGYALGGGLELALACDLIFAADTAQLGQTEARLGFVAGWGGSWRLPRRVGRARAKELFFSARVLAAPGAHAVGLVDFCGDAPALQARCDQFAADVLAGSAESHRQHKQLLAPDFTRDAAAAAEADASVHCVRTPDTAARLRAFLSRRK